MTAPSDPQSIAALIVRSWTESRPVFGNKPIQWMNLLKIAAAGEAGTNLNDMQAGQSVSQLTMRRWECAGLIERREQLSDKQRRRVTYHITSKGLRLLRLPAQD